MSKKNKNEGPQPGDRVLTQHNGEVITAVIVKVEDGIQAVAVAGPEFSVELQNLILIE